MKQSTRNTIGALIAPLFLFLALGVMFFVLEALNVNMKPVLSIILALSPIWLPLALFYISIEQWMYSVKTMFVYDNGRTTLRIYLPQEVYKSPEAMEGVLTQIHNVNTPDNLMQTYLDGKHPLISSLELVSIGGEVRFYVNVPTKKIKNAMEAQLYAQYPGVEVKEELIDYTAEVKWDPDTWDMIAFHLGKKEDEVMPIKTYIDYGMDKLPKEELKFEPMAPMLEYLGSAKPHERVWIQFLLFPHRKKEFKNGYLVKKPTWEEAGKEKINEIMSRTKGGRSDEDDDDNTRTVLTPGERETISAIERNTGKYAFETAIRAIYITENGKFDPDMISPLLRSFAQYDMFGRNGIGVRWRTDFDYNFIQDITGNRKKRAKKNELEYYKMRFYMSGDKKKFTDKEKIMSTEEIATMFHIPGSTVVTPNLARIDTARREAPVNLPTGDR